MPKLPVRPNRHLEGNAIVFGVLAVALIFLLLVFILMLATVTQNNFFRGEGVGGSDRTGEGASVDCSDVTSVPRKYLEYVKTAADQWLHGDQAALIALIQVESSWDPNARNSASSAAGLGQFLTSTARGYKEFIGGTDDRGNSWSLGTLYDNATGHADDARFDPKRSVFAAAHLFGVQIERYGSVGDAYANGYHGGARLGGHAADEAATGRARLEKLYSELKNGGGCHTSSTNGSSAPDILDVPGVAEGKEGDCGHASMIMVALYENRLLGRPFSDPRNYDPVANKTIGDQIACVRPDYLDTHVPAERSGWHRVNPDPAIGLEEIKRSLRGSDPVVFFGSPGLIFSTKHIFVIVGYDSTKDLFAVNNPNVCHQSRCEIETKTFAPNGRTLGSSVLASHFGGLDGTYRHTLIIRDRYL